MDINNDTQYLKRKLELGFRKNITKLKLIITYCYIYDTHR